MSCRQNEKKKRGKFTSIIICISLLLFGYSTVCLKKNCIEKKRCSILVIFQLLHWIWCLIFPLLFAVQKELWLKIWNHYRMLLKWWMWLSLIQLAYGLTMCPDECTCNTDIKGRLQIICSKFIFIKIEFKHCFSHTHTNLIWFSLQFCRRT